MTRDTNGRKTCTFQSRLNLVCNLLGQCRCRVRVILLVAQLAFQNFLDYFLHLPASEPVVVIVAWMLQYVKSSSVISLRLSISFSIVWAMLRSYIHDRIACRLCFTSRVERARRVWIHLPKHTISRCNSDPALLCMCMCKCVNTYRSLLCSHTHSHLFSKSGSTLYCSKSTVMVKTIVVDAHAPQADRPKPKTRTLSSCLAKGIFSLYASPVKMSKEKKWTKQVNKKFGLLYQTV